MAKAELNFGELSGGSGTWNAPINVITLSSSQTKTVSLPNAKSIVLAMMGYNDAQEMVVLDKDGNIVACQQNGTDYVEPFNHDVLIYAPSYSDGVLTVKSNSSSSRNIRYIAEV